MDNKKGYEMYTGSQKQILFLTLLLVSLCKNMRQLICSYFTTGEVSAETLHYDKDVGKLESI